MVVVVIVGVLAVIAVAAIRSYVIKARANEAAAMIQAIRAAQEAYRAETNTYLSVSDSYTSWHPRDLPDENFVSFKTDNGTPQKLRWSLLNPSAPGEGVRWVYVSVAGPAGSTPQALATREQPVWGAAQPRAWYIIQAMGDTDGDENYVYMAASSMTGVVYDESSGD